MGASAGTQTVVVAIGGNASYPPTIKGLAEEQLALMATASEHLVDIVQSGYRLVLTHGNGPVVGNILFRMAKTADELPPMPMDICVAHSQGGMGYMLQQTLANALHRHGVDVAVSSIITRVEVSATDPGFADPTKPVGRFFGKEEAGRLAREHGWQFIEDAGRGYRRVVPSPVPLRILDLPTIEALLAAGSIPIAAGGGGIPVVRDAHRRLHRCFGGHRQGSDECGACCRSRRANARDADGGRSRRARFRPPDAAPDRSHDAPRKRKRIWPTANSRRAAWDRRSPQRCPISRRGGEKVVITSLDRTCDALRGEAGTTILP